MSWVDKRARINSYDEDAPLREEALPIEATTLTRSGTPMVAADDSHKHAIAKYRDHTTLHHHHQIENGIEKLDDEKLDWMKRASVEHKIEQLRHQEGLHYRAHRSTTRDVATAREPERVDHHETKTENETAAWVQWAGVD